jgi:hypothetical protein
MNVPQNSSVLNQEALRWLEEAKESPESHLLHLLVLASWGLEVGAEGDWPERDRSGRKVPDFTMTSGLERAQTHSSLTTTDSQLFVTWLACPT